MKRNIAILYLFFLLQFCTSEPSQDELWLIKDKKTEQLSAQRVFKKISYIKLDEKFNGGIARISKIKGNDQKIILADLTANSRNLVLVDYEGKILKIINNEYFKKIGVFNFEPVDFDLFENKLYILDGLNQKIHILDLKGEEIIYERTLNTSFYAKKLIVTKRRFIFFKGQTLNNFEKKESHYDLIVTDHELNFKNQFLPFSVKEGENVCLSIQQPIFFDNKKNVLYKDFFNDTIWNIDLTHNVLKTQKIVSFETGNYSTRLQEIFQHEGYANFLMKCINDYPNISFGFDDYMAGENYLCFSFGKNSKPTLFFHQKGIDHVASKLYDENQKILIPFPMSNFEDKLFAVIDEYSVEKFALLNEENQFSQKITETILKKGGTYLLIYYV